MKIALAQLNSQVGNLQENYLKIKSFLTKARENNADIIAFPELTVIGYPPEDLLLKPHFIEENKRYLKKIAQECYALTAIIGFVDKINDKLYNACAIIEDKKIKSIYHKIILPNYGVFDEKRYFSSGEEIFIYEFKGTRFAVSICEDLWEQKYINLVAKQNIDFMINISASPFHLRKIALREKIFSAAAKDFNAFLFYCNIVGGQDELVFDGTSKIFSPQGKILKYAKRFQEDLLFFDFSKTKKYKPLSIQIKEDEEAFSALCLGLNDYVTKNGFKKVILGVSGGIDSAVVAALAVHALGKENVTGLIMPSLYTSKKTFTDAKKLCENLKIKHQTIEINPIFKAHLKQLNPFFKKLPFNIAEENLQARIRGNILMAFSNKFGYLVLNTGNKSEVSCGYCTLYGDMVGGFGLIKDVPKMLVYKLAKCINKKMGKVIPVSIIKRAPSAELKPNQKDSDSLPEYDVLDPILKLYVEKDYSLEQIVKKGYPKELVKKIITLVDKNEYKRRQAPIGIKISPKAFGKDRRMPITNKFIS